MIDNSDNEPEDVPSAIVNIHPSVFSALGLIAVLNLQWEEVVARFEALCEHCFSHQCDLYDAAEALGQTINPPIIAASLFTLVNQWSGIGAQQVIYMMGQLLFRDWDKGSEDERFLFMIVSMLEPLAHVELKHDCDLRAMISDSVEAAAAASAVAEKREHSQEALEALDAARSLARQTGLPHELSLAADALRMAHTVDDPDRVAIQSLQYAFALHSAAARDSSSWVPALDAFEDVLRTLPTETNTKKRCMDAILAASCLPGMRPLGPWIAMLVAEPQPDMANNIAHELHAYVPLVLDGDMQAFLNRLQDLVTVVQIAEDERIALQRPPEDHKARADWATWSMRHAAFRSAIPHGKSFLRERDRDQLVLVLNHELTHIVSMASGIGLAIMALRAALTELEVALWVRHAGDELELAIACHRGLAPVADNDLRALALVERELEITLKLRVLQDCWAPWFEGIAMAEELSDPRDDPDALIPSLQALMGLVDAPVRYEPIDSKATFRAKVSGYFSQFEDLYGEAVRTQGPARLQSYLKPPHAANYLAGYLTVRSIVAAWRRTLTKPLAGKAATRIFMHITRYGTSDAVPDLALPLDEFRRQTIRHHLEWVMWVSDLRADQLHATLDLIGTDKLSSRRSTWRNGELITLVEDDASLVANLDARLLELATHAYGSLTGSNAPVDRVAGANDECRAVLKEAGDLLASEHPHPLVVSSLSRYYLSLLRVVPLGEVDAPFWLFPQEKAFCVLIRTTEKHHKHGEPSYNAMLIPSVEGADFNRLQDEVRLLRTGRMTVSRYMDLMPSGVMEGRGFGRNILVFQYGSWHYMLPCGLLMGSADVESTLQEDIENHMHPSPLAELDMRHLADGTAAASRARAWLDSVDEWTLGERRLPLEPWTARVRALADKIENLDGPSEHEAVGIALLRFVLGPDAPVNAAMAGGLGVLRVDDKGTVAGACRLLFATGRHPVSLAEATEMQHWGSLFQVQAAEVDISPPFHKHNQGG